MRKVKRYRSLIKVKADNVENLCMHGMGNGFR